MKISKQSTASFDIDCQKTFTPLCPNELPVPEGDQIVDELNQQAKFALLRVGGKEAHSPDAIWIADEKHPQLSPVEGEDVDVRWVPHAIPGSKGFELLEGLPKPAQYDFFIWKGVELDMHPYGSCYHDIKERLSTGVIEFLKQNYIKTIIVGGLATDYCVKVTVLQLLKADFTVILNLGACRGLAPDTTEAAIAEMQAEGVKIIQSASALSLI